MLIPASGDVSAWMLSSETDRIVPDLGPIRLNTECVCVYRSDTSVGMSIDALEWFHPCTRDWFTQVFHRPTRVRKEA